MDRRNPERNRKYPPRRFPGLRSREIKGVIFCQGHWRWLSEHELLLLNWLDEEGRKMTIEKLNERCELEKVSRHDMLTGMWKLIDSGGRKIVNIPDPDLKKITKAKQRSLKENEYSRQEDW